MTTMNVSLPDEMKAFIEAEIAREGFASASEYLRSLIREAQKRKARRELEAKLLEGLQSPAGAMTDADWAALRQRMSEADAGQDVEETAFDVARRAGLIGCVKGAPGSPTDLSTNPKHMEGFGRG